METTRHTVGVIHRPALAGLVAAALDDGAVLLVAGAGYGKTTALEQGLRESGADAAWVRCTEADRDPGRLLVHVLDAIGAAVPGSVDVAAERLRGGVEPIDPLLAAGQVLSDVDRLLVDRLVVVLDDAEQLEGSPEAVALAGRLLAACGHALRVAVAGRRPLGLKVAKLRATRALTELGPAELAFSAEECAELLRERHGARPSDAEVESAMRATEGWPLGLALADIGGPGAAVPTSRARGEIFAFLEQEVLDALEPELRDAVLDSSLPEELDDRLAATLGLPDRFIEQVEGLGLFLSPVDGDRRWFRYHPLVRECLLARLAAERGQEELRDLHAGAASALGGAGRGDQAVEHWLAAERWSEAVYPVFRRGLALLGASPDTVRGWLARLPAEARGHPAMLVLEGRLEYGAGRHDAAARHLRRAVAAFRGRAELEQEWLARLALMDALHASGDFDEAVALADDLDSSQARSVAAAPNVAVMAAMCLAHQGRLDEAARMTRRATEHPAAAPSAPLALALEGLFLDRPAGRLDDAVAKARRALAGLERSDPFDRTPFVRALLHLVLEEQGLDDQALDESLRARDEAGRIGVEGYLVAMLRMHSVGIHARAGRIEEAERELRLAGSAEQGAGWRQVGVGRAILAAAKGQAAEAIRLCEEALAKVKDGPFLQEVHAVAFLVPVLAGAGQPGRARKLLDETLAGWRPGYSRARLVALRAWLLHGEGDERWGDDLAAAWAEAGDQAAHLVRREGPRLEALLHAALERGVLDPVETVRAIERAWPGGAALLPFTAHPVAAVRRAAIAPAAASGRPEIPERLRTLADDPDRCVAEVARVALERLRESPLPAFFQLLGGFEVRRGAWVVDDDAWSRPMAAKLVRFLLVHGRSPVPEDALFEAFWPDKEAFAARRGLQVAVSRARAVLDPAAGASAAIESSGGTYRLRLGEHDSVDVEDFEVAADAALAEPEPGRRALLERAIGLWSGDPLPEDRYEPWTMAWRERLIDRYLEVLMARCEAAHADGDHPAAVAAASEAVRIDPLNERAHRELIAAYARGGRRGHALRQYLACRRMLVDELGIEPSATTAALQATVLAGDAL